MYPKLDLFQMPRSAMRIEFLRRISDRLVVRKFRKHLDEQSAIAQAVRDEDFSSRPLREQNEIRRLRALSEYVARTRPSANIHFVE